MKRLTGEIQFRVETSYFSKDTKVILQVEEEWGNGPDDSDGLPTFLTSKGWRDATAEDLQFIGGIPC
jgi:hypothetical protein